MCVCVCVFSARGPEEWREKSIGRETAADHPTLHQETGELPESESLTQSIYVHLQVTVMELNEFNTFLSQQKVHVRFPATLHKSDSTVCHM